MKWLLDTDTVIYYMNQMPAVVGQLEATRATDRFLSLITVGELYFGIFRSAQVERNLHRYRRFFAESETLAVHACGSRTIRRRQSRSREAR